MLQEHRGCQPCQEQQPRNLLIQVHRLQPPTSDRCLQQLQQELARALPRLLVACQEHQVQVAGLSTRSST